MQGVFGSGHGPVEYTYTMGLSHIPCSWAGRICQAWQNMPGVLQTECAADRVCCRQSVLQTDGGQVLSDQSKCGTHNPECCWSSSIPAQRWKCWVAGEHTSRDAGYCQTSMEKRDTGCKVWLHLTQSSACQVYSSCPVWDLHEQWGDTVRWSCARESSGGTGPGKA